MLFTTPFILSFTLCSLLFYLIKYTIFLPFIDSFKSANVYNGSGIYRVGVVFCFII